MCKVAHSSVHIKLTTVVSESQIKDINGNALSFIDLNENKDAKVFQAEDWTLEVHIVGHSRLAEELLKVLTVTEVTRIVVSAFPQIIKNFNRVVESILNESCFRRDIHAKEIFSVPQMGVAEHHTFFLRDIRKRLRKQISIATDHQVLL